MLNIISLVTRAQTNPSIGAERFHFRVQKGMGWYPLAIAAFHVAYNNQNSLALYDREIPMRTAATMNHRDKDKV